MPLSYRPFAGMIELSEHPQQTIQRLLRLVETGQAESDEIRVVQPTVALPRVKDPTSLTKPAMNGPRFNWPIRPVRLNSGSEYLLADVEGLVEELEAEVETLLHDVAT